MSTSTPYIIAILVAHALIGLIFWRISLRSRRFFLRGHHRVNVLGYLSLLGIILPAVFLIFGDKEYVVWLPSMIIGFILLLIGLKPTKEGRAL